MTTTDGWLIWHNPGCSTSRFVLGALRDAGIDPIVRDYRKQPPSTAELSAALSAAGLTARGLLRRKNPACAGLGLDRDDVAEAALIAAMAAHPDLIERPLVFAPDGTATLCRPKEKVFDLLPADDAGATVP